MAPAPRTRLAFAREFAIRFVNPVTRIVAGRLPWFGILGYRGRRSGRWYRTPLNVFRHGSSMVIALTYGSEVQWVRNVVAAGAAELRTGGRDLRLVEPEVFIDPGRRLMPFPVRQFLGLLRVTEFLRMRIADETP
jgi:deazaflavin-dependent oxidoreductase (nitroreductase family)